MSQKCTMWFISAFSVFIVVTDLCFAQNPYALKRPSFCSTCFTNDQTKNYYCCFYFFRCCAESRLGSNNKVTTPSPEYPDLHGTPETFGDLGSDAADPCEYEDGMKDCEKMVPHVVGNSNGFSSTYGGRGYPYNVPRVYSAQQPNNNHKVGGSGFTGTTRSRTPYGAVSDRDFDSTEDKARQGGGRGPGSTGDVYWGRMEPV